MRLRGRVPYAGQLKGYHTPYTGRLTDLLNSAGGRAPERNRGGAAHATAFPGAENGVSAAVL